MTTTAGPRFAAHDELFGGSTGVGFRLFLFFARLYHMLCDEVDWPAFDFVEDLADIFADHAEHDELDAAEHHDADEQRGIAGHALTIRKGLVNDLRAVDES